MNVANQGGVYETFLGLQYNRLEQKNSRAGCHHLTRSFLLILSNVVCPIHDVCLVPPKLLNHSNTD